MIITQKPELSYEVQSDGTFSVKYDPSDPKFHVLIQTENPSIVSDPKVVISKFNE